MAPVDVGVVILKGVPAKYEIPRHGAQQSNDKTDSPDSFSAHDSWPGTDAFISVRSRE